MRRLAGMRSNSRGSASSFWTRCLSPCAPSASGRTCTPPSDEAPGALSSAGFPSASITEPRKTASWSSRSCTAAAARGAGKEGHNIGLESGCLEAARRIPNGGSSWAIGSQAGEARIHVSARDDSSSLLPITARQSALFPGTAAAGTATIRVLRLADALPAAEIAARAESRRGRRSYGSASIGCMRNARSRSCTRGSRSPTR